MAEEQQRKKRTNCQCLAIFILIVLVLFSSLYVIPSLYRWNKANDDLQNARTFHILFSYYFSGQLGTPEGSMPDIEGDLTVHYPRGTLIVDDPVTMSGIAIVNPSIRQHVVSITLHFQSAQAFSTKQDENKITKGADLFLDLTQKSNVLTGNATMTWAIEGVYNPYFIALYTNSTGKYYDVGISKDVAITVYPKAQFAQIESNNVSMTLTIAIYALTLVGTGSLFLELWDRNSSSQESKNSPETPNSTTKVRNDDPNNRITRKTSAGRTEHKNKQTGKHQ